MACMSDEYQIAIISDIHLGHDRVHTQVILNTLERTFPDQRLKVLSKIIITGDLFDQRLPFDSDEAYLITRWISKLLVRCESFGVDIDILEGTPSHDNRQSRWFETIHTMLGLSMTLRYFPEITVVELYPNGPTALFIPDEINHDADKTWKQVLEVLRKYGTDTVDFAFMHGMFTYQEPIRTVVSHSEERYQSIVKQRIYIGHHHIHTWSGKIRVPSSIERLRHNEEEVKGHIQVSLQNHLVIDELFVINDKAVLFTTVDVIGQSYMDALIAIDALNAPDGSFIRLKLSREDKAYHSFKEIKNLYPQYRWSTKNVDIEHAIPDSGELIDRPTSTAIRSDTLPQLLRGRLGVMADPVMSAIDTILSEC